MGGSRREPERTPDSWWAAIGAVAEDQTHRHVTAIIKVRTKKVIVVALDGEIIHNGNYDLPHTLR